MSGVFSTKKVYFGNVIDYFKSDYEVQAGVSKSFVLHEL